MSATPRVREEWARRVEAEYTSAAITQHLTLWLLQIGASPDLVRDGLRIVEDELSHAELSHAVLVAAGGAMTSPVARERLALARHADRPLELDVLWAGLRVFCLGETVAVPLFSALRKGCTVPPARAALDRVLRDEVRHRDFGWTLVGWLLETGAPALRAHAAAWLPSMLAALRAQYAAPDADPTPVTAGEVAWGLLDAAAYREILERTFAREYRPRFAALGLSIG